MPTTRAQVADTITIARNPQDYPATKVLEALFPDQLSFLQTCAERNRHCTHTSTGLGVITCYYTIPGTTNETYAYRFHAPKGVIELQEALSIEGTAELLEQARLARERYEAAPLRQCHGCNEWKHSMNFFGGLCAGCPAAAPGPGV